MSTLHSLSFFKAEIILLLGACVTLFTESPRMGKMLPAAAALATLAASAVFCLTGPQEPIFLFQNFYTLDGFTRFFRIFMLAATAAAVLMAASSKALSVNLFAEHITLLLFLCFGLILMTASTNLLSIFLSVELVSILSYLLAGFSYRDIRSKEASLKYLLFGSFCSAIMLYGISLLFGLSGSLNFSEIQQALALPENRNAGIAALVFLLTGIGFKISMVPFHFWAPDVYEGAPAPTAAFFTVAPKAAGFALLIRVATALFPALNEVVMHILYTLCVLTMFTGNILAMAQTQVKRLLAYSSVAQAGYLLIGAVLLTEQGCRAILVYLTAYALANLGAFSALMALSERGTNDHLDDLAGGARRKPFAAACFAIFLLSLAGLPPLAGFIGKFELFSAALREGAVLLFYAAVINSLIGAFYYFKILKTLYFSEGLTDAFEASPYGIPLKTVLVLTLAGTLILGLWPSALLQFTERLFY